MMTLTRPRNSCEVYAQGPGNCTANESMGSVDPQGTRSGAGYSLLPGSIISPWALVSLSTHSDLYSNSFEHMRVCPFFIKYSAEEMNSPFDEGLANYYHVYFIVLQDLSLKELRYINCLPSGKRTRA